MSVEFSALKEKPPTCIPKGYTSEASGPLLFRRSSSLFERAKDSCLDVEIRGLYPIHAAKSICGGTNSINKRNIYMFASIQEIGPEASKVWWVPATFTC